MAKVSFEFVGDNKQLLASINEVKGAMDQLNETSQKLGVSTDDVLKGLATTMSGVGESADEMSNSVKSSKDALSELKEEAKEVKSELSNTKIVLDTGFNGKDAPLSTEEWIKVGEKNGQKYNNSTKAQEDAQKQSIDQQIEQIERLKVEYESLAEAGNWKEASAKTREIIAADSEIFNSYGLELTEINKQIEATRNKKNEKDKNGTNTDEEVRKIQELTTQYGELAKKQNEYANQHNAPEAHQLGKYAESMIPKESVEQVDDLHSKMVSLTQQINKLKESQAALKKSGQGSSAQYAEQSIKIKELTDEYKALEKQKKSQGTNTQSTEEQTKAIDAQKKKVAELTAQYEALTREQKNSAQGKQLKQTLFAEKADLLEMQRGGGSGNNGVEEAQESIKGFDGLLSTFAPKLNGVVKKISSLGKIGSEVGTSVSGGVKMIASSVGALGKQLLALMANPVILTIAAVVGALKMLYDAFKRNEDAMTAGQKMLAPFKALWQSIGRLFDDIVSAFLKIYNNINRTTGGFNAFSSTLTPLKVLITAIRMQVVILSNTIERITAGVAFLADLIREKTAGSKLGAFFNGIKNTLNSVLSSIDSFLSKAANTAFGKALGLDTLYEDIKNILSTSSDLEQLNQDIADLQNTIAKEERKHKVDNAKDELEVAKIREKTSDKEGHSAAERVVLLERAYQLEDNIAKRNEDLAQKKLDLVRKQNALNKTSAEGLDAEAQAEAALLNAQRARFQKQRQINRELNAARRQAKNENNDMLKTLENNKKAIDDMAAAIAHLKNAFTLDEEISALKLRLEYEKSYNEQLKLEQQIRDKMLEKTNEQLEYDRTKALEKLRHDTYNSIIQRYKKEELGRQFLETGKLPEGFDDKYGIVPTYNEKVNKTNEEYDTKKTQAKVKSDREAKAAELKKDIADYTQYSNEIIEIEKWRLAKQEELRKGEAGMLTKEQLDKEYKRRLKVAKDNHGISQEEDVLTSAMSTFTANIFDASWEQIDVAVNALETALNEQEAALASNKLLTEEEKTAMQIKIDAARKQAEKMQTEATNASKNSAKSNDDIKTINKNLQANARSLQAVKDIADGVANTFGGALSKNAMKAVESISIIAGAGISAVNSISSLVSTVTDGFTQTISFAVAGMSALEKASVILTILSIAVQVIQAMVQAFSKFTESAKLQESIDEQKEKIAELERAHRKLEMQYRNSVGLEYYKGLSKQASDYNSIILATNRALKDAEELQRRQEEKYGASSKKAKEARNQVNELQDKYDDLINSQSDAYKELAEALMTTNAADFADNLANTMVESFEDGTRSIESVWEDTLKDLQKSMMKKALSNALATMFEGTFKTIAEKTKDGTFTQAEIDKSMAEIEKLSEEAKRVSEQWYQTMKARGVLDDASVEGSRGGFASMSQDTAEELNARFTALQVEGANVVASAADMRNLLNTQFPIINNTLLQLLNNNTIAMQEAENQLDQLKIIAENTAMLAETNRRLKAIEQNTDRL